MVVAWRSASEGSNSNPIGTIVSFDAPDPPAGWLECNGDLLTIADFPELFAVIGSVHGGDGVINFALPQLQGEALRGWDNGRGVDPGRIFGSAQMDEIRSHAHSISGSGAFTHSGPYNIRGTSPAAGQATSTNSTGGAETRMRNVALLFCIKY